MHPDSTFIKRHGEVNAWDNADFKAAVKATGKSQVILVKPGNRNSYLGIAFIILESGTMFSTATFILVILFVHTPTTQGAAAGISVVMQLAVSDVLSFSLDAKLIAVHLRHSPHC